MAIGARKQPLYDQLVDILTEKIDHEYRAGDMILPSANFGALWSLAHYGTPGSAGTGAFRTGGSAARSRYLCDRPFGKGNQSYAVLQLYGEMRRDGSRPRDHDSEFCEMEADKNLAEHMGLRIGDRIFKLKRLRSADNMPMMVERSYLPVRQFLSLKQAIERKPLYDVIEQTFSKKYAWPKRSSMRA